VDAETVDFGWKGLYRLAGAAAVTAALVYTLDVVLTFGGGNFKPGALAAVDWFTTVRATGFMALRDLGLLNVISLTVLIPVYLALYGAHRQSDRAWAALALALFSIGAAVYLADNAALPMLFLSHKYAAATTAAQRSLLAAAGEAILARGEDFVAGAFSGFILTELAGAAMSLVMLRGKVFGKAAAYAGLLAFVPLTIFTVWTTFIPVGMNVAMLVAMVGGISSLVWFILTATGFFRLGRAGATAQRSRRSQRL
jgi:uncharacterized membrane protein